MQIILIQMAALIASGVIWRKLNPNQHGIDTDRRALTGLVYYLFLPALVLMVLWQAPLGLDTFKIVLVAAAGVVFGLGASWLSSRILHTPGPVTGAIMLAAAFPNATYLGLPVLETTFGPWARRIAIQYDLFACTPLLLTVGIMLAQRLGDRESHDPHPWRGLVRVPALWAAVIAVTLNKLQVPMPEWLHGWLNMLAVGVVPLMLLSLGMALRWQREHWPLLPALVPVVIIQLLLTPLLGWWLAHSVGLSGEVLAAVVLETAMPSMVLGIVLCDRYGLHTGLYATAVTLTTLLSLISLPFWFGVLL